MLETIRAEFPTLQILLGGQAFTHIDDTSFSRFGNIVILTDLYLLEKYIENLN
jgi:hypothetical protein